MIINKITSNKEVSNLLFRYGFVLYDNSLNIKDDFLKTWQKIQVHNYNLLFHYEAKFRKIDIGNSAVLIFGDIFVAHGNNTVEENITNFILLNNWDAIDNLSGRFAIIVVDEDGSGKVIIDPFGARTLFYKAGAKVSLSSHSQLLAAIHSQEKDTKITKYMISEEYKTRTTRFLPGDLTRFNEIYGLTPNNYLSLSENSTIRFWPRNDIKETSLEQLFSCCEEYFKNFSSYLLSEGVKPVFGLTGGVDTRAVIAAFKNNNYNFKTITWDYPSVKDDERKVINEVAKYLNIDNIWIDIKYEENNEKFEGMRDAANLNSGSSRGRAMLPAQTAPHVHANEVFVRGLGGEILRGSFNRKTAPHKKDLTNIEYFMSVYNGYKLNESNTGDFYKSFTLKAYTGFMHRANYQSLFNVDVGDLIYWEQRMAMWAANLNNEYDVTFKNLVGINSRKLYEIAYGLDAEVRFRRELLLDITDFFDKGLAEIKLV